MTTSARNPDVVFPDDWGQSILTAELGTVAALVGEGFERIVRVLNPAYALADGHWKPVLWVEIAAARDRQLDLGASSFKEVSGVVLHSGAAGTGWTIEPEVGGDPKVLLEVASVLRRFTKDPAAVAFGVWDGFSAIRDLEDATVRLESRHYVVTRGPIGGIVDPTGYGPPANLAWSDSPEWLVVSDIDLPASYVAGPSDVADALLRHPDLECIEVSSETRLSEPLS